MCAAAMGKRRVLVPAPVFRHLRTFAVDPGLTAEFATAFANEMTLAIPWEELEPGPTGDYITVVDRDDHDRELFPPLDLSDPNLLATDGLPPSDGNPQFRHQMLYAVSMRTIRNFERALGRAVHWPPPAAEGRSAESPAPYRRRLEIRPHYMQEMNAYYNNQDGLFLFGYWVADQGPGTTTPSTTIFTCLSQDVIAHELTHALLMGMNIDVSFSDVSDSAAFHEAFADLIALFQHFWKSDVLRAQMTQMRGSLDEPNLLGAVALQFGRATGKPDGLRNALGLTVDGVWVPRKPDPTLYQTAREPHQRGDILVGAVFEAFKKIYNGRTSDLRRIATRGTGVLPKGSLHPDLIERLTDEISTCAQEILEMCIRALDYVPPGDITFGDYLRAILTASLDVDPVDRYRHRAAFLEAFRSYGIQPDGISTLSIDTLTYRGAAQAADTALVAKFARTLTRQVSIWNLPTDREQLWRLFSSLRRQLEEHLRQAAPHQKQWSVIDLTKPFEVRTFDLSWRPQVDGTIAGHWVIRITQKVSPPRRRKGKKAKDDADDVDTPDPICGCTLLVDAASGQVRYLIENRRFLETQTADNSAPRPALGSVQKTRPSERRLRVFASDPTLGVQLETAGLNEVTLRVPWERDRAGNDVILPGPVGEYVEVIDRDPASQCFYAPVDLNDPPLLTQNGLAPSESNPQFHQQMVYAVTMRTIQTFERALGRLALWSPDRTRETEGTPSVPRDGYVQRLRIYPHAMREANAYYSPAKKALLFGYFPAASTDNSDQRLTVFTCLSHDIVAHEVTHALLDGMHRRFSEPSNPDVLAFHEAFADLVALFQHFSIPEVLRQQIAATRGDLSSQNRLGELAQQFGQAIGKRGALRSFIGERDANDQWIPHKPDRTALRVRWEPHERGAILVAAVFDAFLTIYKSRVADLLRIASDGTGVLPEGHLHPDLVNRMADEAAEAAQRVLDMCVRALDYCPPVDLTFGDYLRAIITADFEFDPEDATHRRVAFVEAFRRYGIVPETVRTLSVDGLLWRPTSAAPDEDENVVLDLITQWSNDIAAWGLVHNREELFNLTRTRQGQLHQYLKAKFNNGTTISGIVPTRPFEVHSIRPSIRSDWEGRPHCQWIVELTQRIPQWFDDDESLDTSDTPAAGQAPAGAAPDYYFRGGCTLVIEADSGKVRYAIRKRLDSARRARQKQYLMGRGNESLAATYFGGMASEYLEPFAMLHRF